eukprot:NODE_1959_length_1026_cov_666.472709.p1 GENE.NODE_1959_length_1026_cov_666.472709~~NODE_1959_length_1026_cov_666.472709.p1  ORF type:complete len:266 (+),score=116.87 NODE_1959_length_1026_cov_666.472709:3-800(+)
MGGSRQFWFETSIPLAPTTIAGAPLNMDAAKAEAVIEGVKTQISNLEAEIATLTGKDNKKARNTKSREVADLKNGADYIDAIRVMRGEEALQEHNKIGAAEEAARLAAEEEAKKAEEDAKAEEAAKEEAKKKEKEDKKPKKAMESAGISPAERAELDRLKADLIARKAELKAEGMSGGQQNKDPQVMEWVARMQVLKAKAGELEAPKEKKSEKKKGGGNPEEITKLTEEIETYRQKLVTDFGYTKNEIKKDEDMIEMQARLKALG